MKLQLIRLIGGLSEETYFDGWDTSLATYKCRCSECGTELVIDFATVHSGAWGWKDSFTQVEIETLATTFILPTERLPQPWPSLSRVTCAACKAAFIFYAGFDEYRQLTYRLTARGLAHCGGLTPAHGTKG
jgi:hypothetical protein